MEKLKSLKSYYSFKIKVHLTSILSSINFLFIYKIMSAGVASIFSVKSYFYKYKYLGINYKEVT